MTPPAADVFFYHGLVRWDFGLGNPNKAAAVLALLLLVLFHGARRAPRGWARWCCAALAAGTGYVLAHTFSRGGLVAFLAGALVLLAARPPKPAAWRRGLPAALAALALALAVGWSGLAGRLAASAPADDASVGNRLALWRSFPAMVVDAPGGWGAGEAGNAFMGWYQPLDRDERYRTLVSSHLTWLAELGWPGRVCYAWGLAFLVALGVLRLRLRGDPLPLAVTTGFVAAASFSSVAEEALVWAIPLALLAPQLRTFVAAATVRARIVTLAAPLVAAGLLLGAVAAAGAAGRGEPRLKVRRSYDGARIVVGEGAPDAWVVGEAAALGGPAYGRRLRAFARTPEGRAQAWGVARDLAAVPADARCLALCAKAADAGPAALARFRHLKDVRVLFPSRPGAWLAARADLPRLRVFCGELSSACPAADAEGLVTLEGVGDYSPDWPSLAFADSP